MLTCFAFLWAFDVSAQCLQYAAGPYGDQGIDLAGCDGESVNAPYAAWQNELYFSDVIAGGNYTFELVGCNATAWGGDVEITVIDGGTATGGTVTGGTTTVVTGCLVTFTAINTGTAYFVVTTVGGCGTPVLNTDNGVPTITTNSGVACGTCGDAVCESTETYCSCVQDCGCTGADPVFVGGYDTGNFVIAPAPVAYCEPQVNGGGANPTNEVVYVPFAPFGNQACVTAWDITSDFGSLYASTNPISPYTDSIGEFNIGLLEITDADLASSGGIFTITFTDVTTGNGCTFDLVIDMSTAVDAAGAPWAGTVATACPGVCTPPAGTFVSYDCATPSVTINITDLGVPSAGSTGFTAEVRTAGGFVVSTGIPLAIGDIVIPLPNNSQIYNVVLTDGVTTDCEVGFFNSTALYGNCRQADGPATDCVFVMDEDNLSGGFEADTWTYTPFVLNTATPLDSFSHAYLGGYATVNIDSIGQNITIPLSTSAMMHYWLLLPNCADATDVFEFTIDGTVVQTLNGGDVNCNGNWFEVSLDVSAYADGGAHDILFTLSEMGSGAGDGATEVMIDEIILEACGLLCATDLVLTTSEVGTQTYVADNSITSTDAVAANEDVVYDAGQIICLENDFEADAASDFSAIIGGCPVLLAPNSGNSSAKKTTSLNNTSFQKAGQAKKNFSKNAELQPSTSKAMRSMEMKSLK